MDQMSALDSAFLHAETAEASLHIASVAIFEGPEPDFGEICAAIEAKLSELPRFRQRWRHVPLDLGRPVWVDDDRFNLREHVLRTVVPAPGGHKELHQTVDSVMSQHLDLDAPPWEGWVLSGLEDGRWAMVTKVHHSMVDGIAGTDVLSTLLDHSAEVRPHLDEEPWVPVPEPSGLQLVLATMRGSVRERVREGRGLVRLATRMATQPKALASRSLGLGRGLFGFAMAVRPTSASPLIGPIGTNRLYRWTSVPLVDVLAIREHFGVTVNDAVLAGLSNGVRALLLQRGTNLDHHLVRTLVPVSVRHADQRGLFDNRVSAVLLDLPVEIGDARDRLIETSVRMRKLKSSHEAGAGELITELGDATPPALLAAGLHLFFRIPHRHLSTVTTNVPGPAGRLFLLGRRMLSAYPYVPIADRVRVAIAVTSYDGQLLVGVTADRDSVPDVSVIIEGVDQGFAELLDATGPGTRVADKVPS
ncbi:MAG: wax ester/triacylglycerol synthase family O-acyltransferase [Marmoricola sp.]